MTTSPENPYPERVLFEVRDIYLPKIGSPVTAEELRLLGPTEEVPGFTADRIIFAATLMARDIHARAAIYGIPILNAAAVVGPVTSQELHDYITQTTGEELIPTAMHLDGIGNQLVPLALLGEAVATTDADARAAEEAAAQQTAQAAAQGPSASTQA